MNFTLVKPVRKLYQTLLGSVLAASVALLPVLPASADEETSQSELNQKSLLQVYQMLVENHYAPPSEEEILQGAINGMLDVLDDPYTNYMTTQKYGEFMDAINQTYAGVGFVIQVAEDEEGIIVKSLFDGSPAEEAGVQVGDYIYQVDDMDITPENVSTITDYIRGEEGTSVTLHIKRGEEILAMDVIRKSIELPEINYEMITPEIAYINILTFGERTTEEFMEALSEAESEDAKGLIIDVRGNGGGLVNSALEIIDAFLSEGDMLYLHDDGERIVYSADEEASDIPLAVLIDGSSASASEILAGALQTNGRAILVGETSFGKGTMQGTYRLSNGDVLKLTIDEWELAGGKSINKVGLEPDIYIQRSEAMVNAAIQALLPEREQQLTLSTVDHTGVLNQIELSNVPEILEETTDSYYVPLRYVIESFGSEVNWNGETSQIEFTLEDQLVHLDLQHNTLTMNDQTFELENQLKSKQGVTYLSVDSIEILPGVSVEVGEDEITITLD